MERTAEALRIAGIKATNARIDADAAEARAAALESHTTSLKSALKETKKSFEAICKEHGDIEIATRAVESNLFRSELELKRALKKNDMLQTDYRIMENKLKKQTESMRDLQDILNDKEDEVVKLKTNITEATAIDQARENRSERLEQELRENRQLLVEATSATAESESASLALNDTIKKIQCENESLHAKVKQILKKAACDRDKVLETLGHSQSEIQKLNLKSESDKEKIKRLEMDKESIEKEVSQMRNRIKNLEKRLSESNVSKEANIINNLDDKSNISPDGLKTPNNTRTYPRTNMKTNSNMHKIPLLRPVTPKSSNADINRGSLHSLLKSECTNKLIKENQNFKDKSIQNQCCFCQKKSFGLMKTCQCENPNCNIKAHISCLTNNKFLVSKNAQSPGMTILCNADGDKI